MDSSRPVYQFVYGLASRARAEWAALRVWSTDDAPRTLGVRVVPLGEKNYRALLTEGATTAAEIGVVLLSRGEHDRDGIETRVLDAEHPADVAEFAESTRQAFADHGWGDEPLPALRIVLTPSGGDDLAIEITVQK